MTRKQMSIQAAFVLWLIWPWFLAFFDLLAYGAIGHSASSIDWLSLKGVVLILGWPMLAGYLGGVWG